MAAFCGMNYDELKSVVTLTCVWPEGGNIREGIELDTKLIRKMEKGESAVFAGETFRARDGSVRIRLLDGSGFTSIFSMEGTPFLTAPPTPAVETSTDSKVVHNVVVRIRNHRFFAAYRTALKTLGFKTPFEPTSYPAVVSFEHDNGVERHQLNGVFETIVHNHLAKFYAFPKPVKHRSEDWFRYEMWMEYKKEISIWAD
jgi:hypothetical protein